MRAIRVAAAALAIALAGCSGSPASPVPPAGSGPGAHGTTGGWTVSAILQANPDGTTTACFWLWHTYPADCGGAFPVTQLGATRLPFSQVSLTRGAYLTPTMKLTGTWTGSSLALTVPPTQTATETSPVTVWSSTVPLPVAQMEAGVPTAAGLQDQQVLMADLADLKRRGILVIGNGFDATGLYMLVAAADPASVELLRSRYNVHQIDSWLHPVP